LKLPREIAVEETSDRECAEVAGRSVALGNAASRRHLGRQAERAHGSKQAFLQQSAETNQQRQVRCASPRRNHEWSCKQSVGQDIAEYAVMLAVILVVVVGTLRLIGSNTNNVFSNVASTLQ